MKRTAIMKEVLTFRLPFGHSPGKVMLLSASYFLRRAVDYAGQEYALTKLRRTICKHVRTYRLQRVPRHNNGVAICNYKANVF